MTDLKVVKFGGSSITCPEDIARMERIINDDASRKIIVVSAPGKRNASDIKVTDLLIKLAQEKDQSLIERIIDRYQALAPGRDISFLKEMLVKRYLESLPEEAYADSLKSFGEEACASLLAPLIGGTYVNPRDLFLVSSDFGNAKILPVSEQKIRHRLLDRSGIVVVAAFYGFTQDGLRATLSRGGSDLTGSYLAASLDAVVYENFTDKNGIFAAHPDQVPDAERIQEITYEEMRDLSYAGFKIFHQEAMHPVQRKGIPVHVRSAFSYPTEGTRIVADRITDPEKPIVGIAYQSGYCSINISRFGLNEEKGILRKILQVFEESGLAVEHLPSAVDDLSVILNEQPLRERHLVGELTNQLHQVVGEESKIWLDEHLGCLVVAGKGLRGRRGISADIQQALAEAEVNIRFISQGAQERCIIYGLESKDGITAVNAVYDKYFR